MSDLTGRVALVTGSGSGIGRGVALALASRGCNIAVNDINAEAARATVRDVPALGRRALAVHADVADPRQVDTMIRRVAEEFGRVDILVNNAGVAWKALLEEITDEHWTRTLSIHLNGMFYCCRGVIPIMRRQRYGRIVNISSVVAWRTAPYTSAAYTTAKAGIIGFTRQAAFELAGSNITVNAVCPGQTLTPLRESIIQSEEFIRRDLERIPMGRLATPEDVARAVVFFASEESAFITGAALNVDGGMLLSWMPYDKYVEAVRAR